METNMSDALKAAKEDPAFKSAQAAFTNDSAFMIAYERGLESTRGGDALIHDPFAAELGGSKGKGLSENFGEQGSLSLGFVGWADFHRQWTVVRTKFIDDNVERISSEGKEWQFLNLGSGLDTRCFRLKCAPKWKAAFEVDMEKINIPREAMFEALGMKPLTLARRVLSVDFLQTGAFKRALEEADFETSVPSIIVAEGLIMYLADKQAQFLEDVSSIAASGSVLILNFAQGNPVFTREQCDGALQKGGWTDVTWNLYGDEVLNYGRFDPRFAPSPIFSFVVCTKA